MILFLTYKMRWQLHLLLLYTHGLPTQLFLWVVRPPDWRLVFSVSVQFLVSRPGVVQYWSWFSVTWVMAGKIKKTHTHTHQVQLSGLARMKMEGSGLDLVRTTLTFWHRSFTFNSNKSPTWCNNFLVYYPDVCLSSTCFGRFPAHHQELNDCSGNLWFYLRIVVIVVLFS